MGSFTVEQSSREHIVNQNSYLRKAAPCFPTTQTLQANFNLWPSLRVKKRSPGTTGLSRWTRSAPWSLANSNNQPTIMEKDQLPDYIKLWEHQQLKVRTPMENRWRRNQTGSNKCQKM